MDCIYANNKFCSQLNPELRSALCQCCIKARVPAGKIFNKYDWKDTFAFLVDGFVISAAPNAETDGNFVPRELLGCGHFLNIPTNWADVNQDHTASFVILDSVIATFDPDAIEALYRDNLDFVRAICQGYIEKHHDMGMALQEIGGKSAQHAVKYVLQFCRDHNIPQLTHAQIALASGLTRPTVTKTLHELLKRVPTYPSAAQEMTARVR